MRKIIFIFCLIFSALLIAVAALAFLFFRFEEVQKIAVSEAVDVITGKVLNVNLAREMLGFNKPQTYLVLFLNNTEIRPGGGFIGAYALVRVNKAIPELIKVEGTEILDNNAPLDFESVPPLPIKKYLNTDQWFFRDSNWSPDFALSAVKALNLYRREEGVLADQIDAVIGFTPTAIENFLAIAGPIIVDGEEYNAENFTEKLEYEVEYGFSQKGKNFDERKNILKDLTQAVSVSALKNIFKQWSSYYGLALKMLAEKQIMFYSSNAESQKVLSEQKWTGEMETANCDYLLWVDANMGALKTDVAIERELTYQFAPAENGNYLARVKMKYAHKGTFDWRISRYRDYARVYVPSGSVLVAFRGAMIKEKNSAPGPVDQGIENGRQWFGAFIAIEPGQTGELIFEYYIAPAVAARIKNNSYKLIVQKQLGSVNTRLTLDLDFGKKLTFSAPGENAEKQGDGRYNYSTVLKTDSEVEIRTEL